jgi:signal transduction histidine kinase
LPLDVKPAPAMVRRLRETCHDMRQPVASVLALAAATLTEPDLSAAARGRLEQIAGQAEWLADMIHDCLAAYGQEELGEMEESAHGHADVVHIAGEAVAAERLTWSGDVTLTSPAGPAWCALHPVLLRRIVANVLGNATRAAGPAGEVSVEIRPHPGAVALAVEDNGPGFGAIPGGTGLGFSFVAGNVVRNGGRMECSSGVRGGARVSLWLPE